MKSLPLSARLYVAAVVSAAAVLLATAATLPRLENLHLFVGLTAATIVASTFKLHLPTVRSRATLSVAFIVDFASLLLLGAQTAVFVSAIGAFTQCTLRAKPRNPPHKILMNVACLVITVMTAGLVYRLCGGGFPPFQWPHDALPLVAAATTFFLVNSATVACAIALSTRQSVIRVWHDNFLWAAPTYVIGAIVSGIIAQIGGTRLWDYLPLALIPIYVTYRAYLAFAGRLEAQHRHREVVESLNEGMAVVQGDGRIALWNDALERMTGVPRRRALGRSLVDAIPELATTVLPWIVTTVLESGKSQQIEHIGIHRDGREMLLDVRVFVFMNGVTIFWNDVTHRAQAEAALKHSEQRYALAAAGSNDSLWDWDLVRDEVHLTERWHAMLGLPASTACDHPSAWFERVHPDDLQPLQSALSAHLAGDTTHFEHEHRLRHENGTYRRVLCRGVAVRESDGKATRIAGSQTDITERATIQEQLRHAALHDALTGLPNRLLFMELLAKVLDRTRRHPEHGFAVLFLDIDRFKVVNDSLGHQVGDELLIAVSRRLEACMRQGDAIARLGGDEFTILSNDLGTMTQATIIAERILEALRDPILIMGREVFVTGSIGIAVSASGYHTPEDIMRDADTAMYRAKAMGKARYELFDASMHARAVERLRLESDLRKAIERGEFTLYYQPIVSMKTGEWTGFEALLRWQRPGRELSPSEFVPIVEEMGLIDLLGTWVIQEACRQIRDWRQRFPNVSSLAVTVNISARQLSRSDFVQTVRDAILAENLRAGDLRIEITETTLMEDPDTADVVLQQLRALGVKVYLDDFGTGFSSLSYLHRFPVDTLKIDQSFMASLSGANPKPAIVQSIVALARAVGTHVVAEGVETEAQMHALVRLGCSEAQGFFFARPLPVNAADTFLAQIDATERTTGALDSKAALEHVPVSTRPH